MNDLFEPARWPGGPVICIGANLPAFASPGEANAFHETHAPGTHNEKPWLCEFCQHWHYASFARGPSGESNGSSRYAKQSKH